MYSRQESRGLHRSGNFTGRKRRMPLRYSYPGGGGEDWPLFLFSYSTLCACLHLQILVLELNDEAAEQTVEAKVVDLLQGQEGFRWKVRTLVQSLGGFFSCVLYLLVHATIVPSHCGNGLSVTPLSQQISQWVSQSGLFSAAAQGHTRLDVREEPVLFPPGFQPFALVQCQPPAVVTALNLHSEWKLVAFGTSHGFGLYDYQQKNTILVK